MRLQLEQLVQNVLKQLGIDGIRVEVTPSDAEGHGDYASNIAFLAAKNLKVAPMEAAEVIRNALCAMRYASLEKIEVAKPGFINFTISAQALLRDLTVEHKKPISGSLKDSKVMIEFTDQNPFKEFHIGHLYSNIVGESISRLLEAVGAEVKRVNYQGDIGLHVAKSIWGMKKEMADGIWVIEEMEKRSLKERSKSLGEAYALGATAYDESEEAKAAIILINKQVYVNDPEVMPLYIKGRQWSLDYFETIYQRLGTDFWKLYFESNAGPIGLALVREYLAKGVFKESDGAIVFIGEDYGLHTRVFINSLGLPTYEAKELGLAVTKYEDYQFDSSIMITGNEINEYFKVLIKALSLIRPEIAAKMKHLSHGMVRLPEGKMSSRTGKIVTGEWLLDEAVKRAWMKIQEVTKTEFHDGKDYATYSKKARVKPSEQNPIAETIGVGAVKWALLKNGIGKDIEFSFDESVSFEGNSGPYIQYTYVRTQSVLAKGKAQRAKSDNDGSDAMPYALSSMLNPEERRLLVLLSQYFDIVTQAAQRYSPNILATYLFELAQTYNNFYQKHQILKAEGQARELRLVVTEQVGQTIKNGLCLLGIKTPEKM